MNSKYMYKNYILLYYFLLYEVCLISFVKNLLKVLLDVLALEI